MSDPQDPANGTQDATAGVPASAIARDLARIDRMAHLLDAQFKLPLIPVRFGVDSVIGLVPGVGDLLGVAPSGWIIAKG